MNCTHIHIICPYCGNKNTAKVDQFRGKRLMYCDIDNTPGCGKEFLAEWRFKQDITIYKLEKSIAKAEGKL